MKPLLIAALAALPLAAPVAVLAQASGGTTYADCRSGAGCRCVLSDLTAEDVAVVLGDEAANPKAGEMILVADEAGLRWSSQSVGQADAAHGGDGVCPIELFPAIVPRDGTWTGTVRATDISTCPGPLSQMLPAMTQTMVMSRTIAWGGTFDPRQLGSDPDTTAITWTAHSPTVHSGRLAVPDGGPAMTVDGRLSATLTSADTATATLRLHIGMAAEGPAAAVLAQAGLADCRVTALYAFARTGP